MDKRQNWCRTKSSIFSVLRYFYFQKQRHYTVFGQYIFLQRFYMIYCIKPFLFRILGSLPYNNVVTFQRNYAHAPLINAVYRCKGGSQYFSKAIMQYDSFHWSVKNLIGNVMNNKRSQGEGSIMYFLFVAWI